jgi:hypothetical protein
VKSDKRDLTRALLISRDYWDVPVRVRLLNYVQFIRRLDGELEELIAQWAHTAAPNARRRRQRER